VGFGGRTEWYRDRQGRNRIRWLPDRSIRGVAYDTPVPGFKVNTMNILRLWRAEALKAFDLAAFNLGDYFDAVEEKIASENISKVLYQNDQSVHGRRLRLEQQCAPRGRVQYVSGRPSLLGLGSRTRRHAHTLCSAALLQVDYRETFQRFSLVQ
jgi:glucan phosphorylase